MGRISKSINIHNVFRLGYRLNLSSQMDVLSVGLTLRCWIFGPTSGPDARRIVPGYRHFRGLLVMRFRYPTYWRN